MICVGEKHRVHPAYILIQTLKSIRAIIIPFLIFTVGSLVRTLSDLKVNMKPSLAILIAVGAMVLFLGIFCLTSVWRRRYIWWQMNPREIVFHTGIFSKKTTKMPYERIHAVNLRESALEQVFHVASVRIDSAGGGANSDITIPCIRVSEAEWLRRELIALSGGTVATPSIMAEQAAGIPPRGPEVFYKLTPKELFIVGLSSGKTFAFLLAGVGTLWQFLNNFGLQSMIAEQGESILSGLLSYGVPVLILILLILLLITWLISIASYALKYFGFSIRGKGEKIEIQQGLLEKRTIEISPGRIQELIIKRGLVQRIFGYATLKVNLASNIAKDDAGKTSEAGVILHPFIKKERIASYIQAFLPAFSAYPRELKPLPPVALRRSVLRYGRTALFFILVGTAVRLLALGPNLPGIAAGDPLFITVGTCFFIFLLTMGALVWKGRAIFVGRDMIAFRRGGFGRVFTYIPCKKIQFAENAQNPFQRMAHVATITACTAANGSNQIFLRDVDIRDADYYMKWYRASFCRTQGDPTFRYPGSTS